MARPQKSTKQPKTIAHPVALKLCQIDLRHHAPFQLRQRPAVCFAKITDVMDRDKHLFVSEDEAKPILKAGLKAQDPQIRENAERDRENLLRLGRFDFLNLEGVQEGHD